MYSTSQVPWSASFSSVGHSLSVLACCRAVTNAPGDENFIGIRFLVMMIFPLKTSSGFAAQAAPASANNVTAMVAIATRLFMYSSRGVEVTILGQGGSAVEPPNALGA